MLPAEESFNPNRSLKRVFILPAMEDPRSFWGSLVFLKEKWLPHYYEPDHHKWTEYVGDQVRRRMGHISRGVVQTVLGTRCF